MVGARKIAAPPLGNRGVSVSSASVWGIRKKHEVRRLVRIRKHANVLRYQASFRGDQVHMDQMEVGPREYQFTAGEHSTNHGYSGFVSPAVDHQRSPDCMRWQITSAFQSGSHRLTGKPSPFTLRGPAADWDPCHFELQPKSGDPSTNSH
jgi:hypothetical protein